MEKGPGLRAVEAYFTITDQACALWWCLAVLSRTQHTFAFTLTFHAPPPPPPPPLTRAHP